MIQAASEIHFAICVFFNNFKQCNFSSDFLAICDGVSEGTYANPTPMIGKYCGDSLPPNQISTGNVLYIHFHTDWYDDNNNGFKLEYHTSSKNLNYLASFCFDIIYLKITELARSITGDNALILMHIKD